MKKILELKPVEGYEDLYYVSNYGQVWSCRKHSWLKPEDNGGGYQIVNLCKNKTVKRMSVHRLVAQAFLPNPYKLPEINHKDNNPANNDIDNLEWCTHYYNTNYGTHVVKVYDKVTGMTFRSLTEASKLTGVSIATIHNQVKKGLLKHEPRFYEAKINDKILKFD